MDNSHWKHNFCLSKYMKYCGKNRKCSLAAASPFPVMFSYNFFLNSLPHLPILGFSNSAANKRHIKNMDKWGYNYVTEWKT